jgi:hypothetical protein
VSKTQTKSYFYGNKLLGEIKKCRESNKNKVFFGRFKNLTKLLSLSMTTYTTTIKEDIKEQPTSRNLSATATRVL